MWVISYIKSEIYKRLGEIGDIGEVVPHKFKGKLVWCFVYCLKK